MCVEVECKVCNVCLWLVPAHEIASSARQFQMTLNLALRVKWESVTGLKVTAAVSREPTRNNCDRRRLPWAHTLLLLKKSSFENRSSQFVFLTSKPKMVNLPRLGTAGTGHRSTRKNSCWFIWIRMVATHTTHTHTTSALMIKWLLPGAHWGFLDYKTICLLREFLASYEVCVLSSRYPDDWLSGDEPLLSVQKTVIQHLSRMLLCA